MRADTIHAAARSTTKESLPQYLSALCSTAAQANRCNRAMTPNLT
jgi:hypothetical protein